MSDKKTTKKPSRQLLWQQRQKAKGKCPLCGKTRARNGILCPACRLIRRERNRKLSGSVRRNVNSRSYKAKFQGATPAREKV